MIELAKKSRFSFEDKSNFSFTPHNIIWHFSSKINKFEQKVKKMEM